MASLETKRSRQIEILKEKFEGNNHVKDYENILAHFEELVKSGLIKKRGNNLMSSADIHAQGGFTFNKK